MKDQSEEQIKQEADALAQAALVPKEKWNADSIKGATSVQLASSEIGISPCIVAGRVRYESGDHRLFGKLFREKVKRFFIE